METIEGIMELVTKEELEGLATRYEVKLRGELIFKWLMRLILMGKKGLNPIKVHNPSQ